MAFTNPQWAPNATVSQGAVIEDANGNVQQCVSPGVTGSTPPSWPVAPGSQTQDNSVIWQLVILIIQPETTPGGGVPTLPAPSFLNDADGLDPNQILKDMITAFQSSAGRTLQPAQVERLLINLYAYRESIVRNQIQFAGEQNLLAFASFPMIDYLGQLLGVTRLAAQPALTTLQFTLAAALAVPFTIPAGTLVGTQDGQFQFATSAVLTIPAGATTGTVNASCSTPGAAGNGYVSGQVNVLLNPSPQIASVTNTSTTGGGGDIETDDHLRARIQAAPNRFSVAGPSGAYRFFALGVDPSIIDVFVTTPAPGQVSVYVLTGPITVQPAANPNSVGIAPPALLTKVLAALSATNVRPLTDTVNAFAVSEVDYQITGTVELYADANAASTMAAVNAAAAQFAVNLASRIQRDIVPEEIIAALGSIQGVYRVTLTSPTYTQLTTGQWANCTAINLTQTTAGESS
jgi:phage-related baseplate assembly protein